MTSHGLTAAIFHAYNNHQHLLLTPDDIWLTIAQGVKKRLVLLLMEFCFKIIHALREIWPEVVNMLVVKTDQAVEKIDVKSLLECDFSTTTKNSLTASRIVLLDMLKEYFSFKCYATCGIPKVTLEGTLEDWVKLQEKVVQLRQLDLDMDFWLDRLDPVVWKLFETYKGNVDEEFWSKIISKQSFFSGPSIITGWMTFLLMEETNTELYLKFVAGFLGAQQKSFENSNELVVSPVIGWFVIDDKTEESNLLG
ncbi:unnamed protein product [Rhizophagus irregularis]|nr:unnamed protein product [Rhizophagus irregularis]